jgi:multidrug efflux pump subunit AcrB
MASISQTVILAFDICVSCPGADADVIVEAVTIPLERRLSAIRGLAQISAATWDGESNITVEFELGCDMERARQEVQAVVDTFLTGLEGRLSCARAGIGPVEKGLP